MSDPSEPIRQAGEDMALREIERTSPEAADELRKLPKESRRKWLRYLMSAGAIGLIGFAMWLRLRGDETDPPAALLDDVGTATTVPRVVVPIEGQAIPKVTTEQGIDPDLLRQAREYLRELGDLDSSDDSGIDREVLERAREMIDELEKVGTASDPVAVSDLLEEADKIIKDATATSPDDPHVDPLEEVGVDPTPPTSSTRDPAPTPTTEPTPVPTPPDVGVMQPGR